MKSLEMIWSYKECQKVLVGRGLGRFRTKKLLVQTISDNIFGIKWSNPENWTEKEKLVSFYACFLTAIGKVLEGRLSTSICAHPNLRFY